jgi:sugar (pentulose or hexulose) kinase
LLAAVGACAFPDIEAAGGMARPSARVEPQAGASAVYRQTAVLYADLYQALEPLYKRRMALEG